jgi:hypothetical protein
VNRSVCGLVEDHELLILTIAYWRNQATLWPQLMDQLRWYFRWRRSQDDAIVRRMLGPALIPVSMPDCDIAVAQSPKLLGRRARKLQHEFYGVHSAGEFGEYGGLISGPRADLEYAMTLANFEQLCHDSDDVRLRDRSATAYIERSIVVGEADQILRNELLPRYRVDRTQHVGIMDAALLDVLG